MTEYRNINLSIVHNTKSARSYGDLAVGILLGLIFIITSLRTLMGAWTFPMNFGGLLNQILDNITVNYPLVHDYFAQADGISVAYLLLFLVGASALVAAIWASVRYHLWVLLIAVLLAETGLQVFLEGCPWYLQGLFYLAWASAAFWVLSERTADLLKTAVAVSVLFLLAAGVYFLGNETDTDSPWSRIQAKEHAVEALPQGDFSHLKEFKLTKEKVFSITMSEPDSYYLKGYVGETYTGTGWTTLDKKKLSQYNDLFYWLHRESFYGYSQIEKASGLLEKPSHGQMQISYLNGKSKYLLLPYETVGSVPALRQSIGDNDFRAASVGGTSKYTLSVTDNKIKEKGQLKQKLFEQKNSDDLKDYLICESNYRDFAYDNYTSLDKNSKTTLKSLLGKNKDLNLSQIKEKVLKELNTFTYDENTTFDRSEGGFLETFLEEKSGYSVHFATTAALMFRYYGIPARYVEGYLITPEDVKDTKKGEALKIDGAHAHSWMEYYEDGLGWVPFETTGPYIGVMGNDDNVSFGNTPDNNDKDEEQQKKEKKEKTHLTPEVEIMDHALWILAGVLLLLLLLIAAILIWLKRKVFTSKGTRLKDDKAAITAMMAYILGRMTKAGLMKENIPLSGYVKKVNDFADAELAQEFQRAAEIYEKAVYSGEPVTKEERRRVEQLAVTIKKKLRTYKRGVRNERKKQVN